ncbi:hypothetical protein R1flu_017024 [Riccia fluitans]|uniref:Uncharacterized protein n=1 Tax=Riccia fluitans TaxID=41844 RepID=A0ABD1YNT0_9MARC
MTNNAYFSTPQAAMAQVISDIGLSSLFNNSSCPFETLINSPRCFASVFIGDNPTGGVDIRLPNFVVQTGVPAQYDSFVTIQFHLPHPGAPPNHAYAHFHVREASRVYRWTPSSNQGTYLEIRGSRVHIRQGRTQPGCRDHYFIRSPGPSERERKNFRDFVDILSNLLRKCWCVNKDGVLQYTDDKVGGKIIEHLQGAWRLHADYTGLVVKGAVPGAVAVGIGNQVAEQILIQAGKKAGVKVIGSGVGQGVGKLAGGVGAFGGLASDIAIELIPGAKEAVGEGGRVGIGFASSAAVGGMIAGPVGAAVGVIGYGIGEGVSQLFKLF